MNPLPRLVVASANPDKVAEITLVLDGFVDLDPRPPDLPDVVEDGDTLEANARLKAVAICEATGRAAVADDTGLEVDALGGAPGVHTGRYAGDHGNSEANMGRLLGDLAGVPAGRRTARFRTVALVRRPDGTEVVATGTVEGHIADRPRGDGGFGYDPVFVPVEGRIAEAPTGDGGFGYDPVFVPVEGDGRSFAEMGDEKHNISHRGRAFRILARRLATDD